MEWIPKTLCVSGTAPALIAKTLRAHLAADDLAEVVRLLCVEAMPAATERRREASPPAVPKNAAEAIYQAYPRKVGKAAALKAITKALAKAPYAELLKAVQEYAQSRVGKDEQFTPHPATWFNREQWTDERSEWFRPEGNGRSKAARHIGAGERFDPNAGPISL
jgi:hypothetical protein